ncbi:hypothetical protein MKW98_030885 [Papaver atlanticum]|uniref:Uncharacterized protein n=1 Tax=Papaver atlanticum TaxID=357466 RepID=A0AAD4T915_9MAGN|nr:hypothetical protein MKW98_030885 [Papaver atlanticum]
MFSYRGANDYMLDEMERALDDALCIVKRTLEFNVVLSVNAAKDATDLVAKLRAYHHTAQTKADKMKKLFTVLMFETASLKPMK